MLLTLRKRRKAIALMMTLIVAALLLMLTSAFFSVNTEQIRLQRNSEVTQRASAAALSGLEYARMRLEADSLWGIPDQGRAHSRSTDVFRIVEEDNLEIGGVKTFVCIGVLSGTESHFQINLVEPGNLLLDLPGGRVADLAIAQDPAGSVAGWSKEALPRRDLSLNYLNAGAFFPPLKNARTPERTLLPGQVLLQVRGYCRGTVRTLEVNFAGERQTEAAVQSGGVLAMDFDSSAPGARWRVQSVVWDKNRIESTGKMILGGIPDAPRLLFDHWNKGVAASQSRIQTSPGIQSVSEDSSGGLDIVFSAPPDDLVVPPAQAHANGTFRANTGVADVSDLSKDSAESLLSKSNYHPVTLPGGVYEFTNHETIQVGGTVYSQKIMDGPTTVATIRDHKLIFTEGVRVDFTGSTTIRSQGANTPSVLVGYHPDGWLPWNSKGSFLKVNQGDLVIDGSLAGNGAVMTTGNSTSEGSISLQGKSQMSSDPDSGVTMFAERNIRVGAPDPSSAEFFHFDLAAISQGMEAYVASTGASWDDGSSPLSRFADLGEEQNLHTQGGQTVIDDSSVLDTSIKTAPVNANLSELKAQLESTFPILANPAAQAEFQGLYDHFMNGDPGVVEPGMTVGRYVRLREFAREMQLADDRGEPLPTSDLADPNVSNWAQVDKNNARINDQLKAEISYFHRKAGTLGKTLKQLIKAPNAGNPDNNPLTGEMNVRDARWTGLMYARGSVWVDSGGGRLDVRGSLVARSDVAVTNSTGVTTVYDPRYLNGLTRYSVGNKDFTKLAYEFYRVR